jgi:predicted DNA-binding protein (MmcQ/YjbR family)
MSTELRDAVRAFAASLPEAWDDDVPFEMVTAWIEESYRLVAPKRLVARLASRPRHPLR